MTDPGSLFHQIFIEARDAGFDTAGIAPVPAPGSQEDYAELRQFAPWIEAGRAGEMEYLKRRSEAGELLRSSLRIAIPWARSVIVCVSNYNSPAPRSIEAAPEGSGWIARYAWTGQPDAQENSRPSDYHNVLLKQLKQVESRLHERLGAFASKCFVDTGPLVERIYAKYAGVGWTAKNTCLINQQLGSWLFLGVIVTSIEMPESTRPALAEDRCGSCRRCIDACPTGALTEPYQMDASLCIAYLTIEKRGAIPTELRSPMGRQVFGCDICQDVCPWNRKAPISSNVYLGDQGRACEPSARLVGGARRRRFRPLVLRLPGKAGQVCRFAAEHRHRDGEQRPGEISAATARLGRGRGSRTGRVCTLGHKPDRVGEDKREE